MDTGGKLSIGVVESLYSCETELFLSELFVSKFAK